MSSVDRFFDGNLKQFKLDSRAATSFAARELERDLQGQIRRNFRNPSVAFSRGIKLSNFDGGSYVRLSTILSAHAQETELGGSPNLWILLTDGQRLGFKRIGAGFDWSSIKRRYGTKISFARVSDGHVVLFRSKNGVVPIYKIQQTVRTKQKIKFYESAERIARNYERFSNTN